MNRRKHHHSLKELLLAAGFSKQAHSTYVKRRVQDENLYNLVLNTVLGVRTLHPIMGLKKIFSLVKPDALGRDKFLEIGSELGLLLPKIKNYQRTTFSARNVIFSNLTANLEIRDVNQVWVSDITYFRIKNAFYYISLIEDVYSRRILGYAASPNLRAQACCRALNDALETRADARLNGLIHHSDRGTQYTSNIYLDILKEHFISVSMCDSVYENSHIERLNGIIKGEYLSHRNIQSFPDLIKALREAVQVYNSERIHWSLNCLSPIQFENSLLHTNIAEKKPLVIFTDPTRDIMKRFYQGTLF
jgi:putative transposase